MGSIPCGLLLGIVVGRTMGLKGAVIGGLVQGIADGFLVGLSVGTTAGLVRSGEVFGTIALCYLIGYYRLPLYPFSAFSSLKASLASREKPAEVFRYLHRCSLYWDERVYLPSPV